MRKVVKRDSKTDDNVKVQVTQFNDLKMRNFVATNDSSEVIVATINTEPMRMSHNAEPKLMRGDSQSRQNTQSSNQHTRQSSKSNRKSQGARKTPSKAKLYNQEPSSSLAEFDSKQVMEGQTKHLPHQSNQFKKINAKSNSISASNKNSN